MKKTAIITGCYGFIGSYITKLLSDKGWNIMGIDKMTYASDIQNLKYNLNPSNFRFVEEDINNIEYLPEVDYIINTAAETHVDNSIIENKEFINSNISGVHHLLELIRTKRGNNMPTLLHFSTDEVYGDIVEGSHKETDILKPSNPYSATKASADMLIQAWHRTYNLPYIIVRPTNNYGIGQHTEKLIPKTIKYLNQGKLIPLHNNGTPVRSWLHAADTAKAVLTIIESGIKNEIFNIGSSEEFSNIEIVSKIIKEYWLSERKTVHNNDIKNYIDFNYVRPGQDVRYSLDDSKLRQLGWKNKYKLDIELEYIIKFYKERVIW